MSNVTPLRREPTVDETLAPLRRMVAEIGPGPAQAYALEYARVLDTEERRDLVSMLFGMEAELSSVKTLADLHVLHEPIVASASDPSDEKIARVYAITASLPAPQRWRLLIEFILRGFAAPPATLPATSNPE